MFLNEKRNHNAKYVSIQQHQDVAMVTAMMVCKNL